MAHERQLTVGAYLVIGMLLALGFAKDAVSIIWTSPIGEEWVLLEAGVLCLSLVLILSVPAWRGWIVGSLALVGPRHRGIRWALNFLLIPYLLTLSFVQVLDPLAEALTQGVWPDPTHTRPPVTTPWLQDFDLTVGLILVAAVEEFLYRVILIKELSKIMNVWAAVVAAALIFASVHWEGGAEALLTTFFFGLISGAYFVQTGSASALIAAHWLINVSIHLPWYMHHRGMAL